MKRTASVAKRVMQVTISMHDPRQNASIKWKWQTQ